MKSIGHKFPKSIPREGYGHPAEGKYASVELLGCFGEWAGQADRGEMLF